MLRADEANAQAKADAAKAIKDECEADLAVAMPILNEALAALDTIKEADIRCEAGRLRGLHSARAARRALDCFAHIPAAHTAHGCNLSRYSL